MKIIHFADTHLGMENYSYIDKKTGLSKRFLDFLNTFDQMIEYIKKNQIDLVLFAGDAYKTRDPSPTHIVGFSKRIKEISKYCPVVMVVGNHDLPAVVGKANTLDVFSSLEVENVYIIREISLKTIDTKSGKVQILSIPWLSKSSLISETKITKNIDETHKVMQKCLIDKISKLKNQLDPKLPAIILGHLNTENAVLGSEQLVYLGSISDIIVPIKILDDAKFNYVGLGHLHKYQELKTKNTSIVYSGSLDRIDFSESKEEKGFAEINIKKKHSGFLKKTRMPSAKCFDTNFKFHPLNVRSFQNIKIDLSKIKPSNIIAEIKKKEIKNSVVKLEITGQDEELSLINEAEIQKVLKLSYYVASYSKVSKDSLNEQRKILLTESLGHLETIEKYFEELKLKKNHKEKLIQASKELLEEID